MGKLKRNVCSGCKYFATCGTYDRTEPCNGKEELKTVVFFDREMELSQNLHSIFDIHYGAGYGNNGEYLILFEDYATKKSYAVSREVWFDIEENCGRTLSEKETAKFCGEFVRGMTEEEERLWDMDMLNATVDIWGNIKM